MWDCHDDAAYKCAWHDISTFRHEGVLFVSIPVTFVDPGYFQDGHRNSHPVTVFHGTRETNICSILDSGLHPSFISHGVRGLWVNESLRNSITWNVSLLDFFPGITLELQTHEDYKRKNREICQGDIMKSCIPCIGELQHPPVVIQRIILSCPHPDRLFFRVTLAESIKSTFPYLYTLPFNQGGSTPSSSQFQTWATQCWRLTAHRLAYRAAAGSMTEDFGYGVHTIDLAIIKVSIAITDILSILSLSSINTRRNRLSQFSFGVLPQPLRQTIENLFPSIRQFVDYSRVSDVTRTEWTFGRSHHTQHYGATDF